MAMERWRPRRNLMPWNPYRELEDMESHMDRMFGESLFPSVWLCVPEAKAWLPKLDVFKKGGKFIVKAELHGLDEKDINVSMEGEMLTIKGEEKTKKEVKEEGYCQCERSYGSFFPSISLPSSDDKDNVEADYHNSVLEVTLPKITAVRHKKVKVSAGKKAAKQ
jgi:HSP20 family protein